MASSSRGGKQARNEPSASPPPARNPAPPTPASLGIIFTDASDRARFKNIARQTISTTRFPKHRDLTALGVDKGVFQLLNNIGLARILLLGAETHPRITLEFLSSLRTPSRDTITFRMFNQDRRLSLDQINIAFGFDRDGTLGLDDAYHSDFDPLGFWMLITNERSWEARTAKSSLIRHPCLCIAHKIIVCAIFSRQETGTITSDELYFSLGHDKASLGPYQRPPSHSNKWSRMACASAH
ncbi:hypothetical protein L6452_32577 [Arctium lappa]|uniref:Uncharacterized protein n=1 Tax=Arctium lappa TaxID=4217 RepID=A0ACB8Z9A3_ARCLA|nr:hypothetical protein L6452_32577 [Arctium lappa]